MQSCYRVPFIFLQSQNGKIKESGGDTKKRKVSKKMDAEDLEKRWQQKSQEAFQTIAQWRQDHPKATMAEIETLIDQQLDEVRARIIEEVAQAQMSAPAVSEEAACPQCGEKMHHRGTRARRLQTRGRQEVTLTRDYLSCPACGYSFFPPR
jgi:NADH pyrophosphatase NudC (nudix superfamily)